MDNKTYQQLKRLFTQPEKTWPEIWQKENHFHFFLRKHLLVFSGSLAFIVFLLYLLKYPFFHALSLGFIQGITTYISAQIVFYISREYLCRKLNYSESTAFTLAIYCYLFYIIFYSIAQTLNQLFIGQLFTLLSFWFLRVLYLGIKQLEHFPPRHQTNVFIIVSLSIIFIPIIILHFLRIVFGISAINI